MQRAKIKMRKGFWNMLDGHLDSFPDRRYAYPVIHTTGWEAKTGWDDRDEAIEWLDKNIGDAWVWNVNTLWFFDERDALLFMLRWSDKWMD
jgi:hypothetical protein